MITVTEGAKDVLRDFERPEGTVLRLDPVEVSRPDEFRVRLGAGEPRGDDQVVERDGEDLLRIARPISEELNCSEIALVETLEGPSLGIKPPPVDAGPLPDGS